MDPIRKMSGGPPQSVVPGQRRLHAGPPGVLRHSKIFSARHKSAGRFICLSREQKVANICEQVATLGGSRGRCPTDSSRHSGGGVICQPPLVSDSSISPTFEGVSRKTGSFGGPLLGFDVMVAPTNKNEKTTDKSFENSPVSGFVYQLLGGKNAPPSVAPDLPDLLRQILEGRKIQNSTVDDFLQRNRSLKRYNSAFRLLWCALEFQKINPPEANSDQLADAIIQIFKVSPAQARNAYSACLLIPGIGSGLRFHPLLSAYKRLWNAGNEKYASFYDAWPLLMHLAQTTLEALRGDVAAMRTQLIMCTRLLCLYRSGDLSNLKRTASLLGGSPFIKIRRKGQKFAKWEKITSIPDFPQISPFHLLQAYVEKTRFQGKPGGPVLLSLNTPFKPLSSDTVCSITKKALETFGIDTKIFGPNSTRGAGVGLMKRLGLSGEQVCEIGKWKSVQAFVSHYQRLDSHEVLQKSVGTALTEKGVHTGTSPRGSAEPEVSRTPPRATERGGRDTEGEAQSLGEPTRPAQKRMRSPGEVRVSAVQGGGAPLDVVSAQDHHQPSPGRRNQATPAKRRH